MLGCCIVAFSKTLGDKRAGERSLARDAVTGRRHLEDWLEVSHPANWLAISGSPKLFIAHDDALTSWRMIMGREGQGWWIQDTSPRSGTRTL